jgi:hypothetical protein
LTEWVVTINAIIVSLLVLILPSDTETEISIEPVSSFKSSYKRAWALALGAVILSGTFFVLTNRWIYQYPAYEKLDFKHIQTRFGREAGWRSKPILKNGDHK